MPHDPQSLLSAYDAFMGGDDLSAEQHEAVSALIIAVSFAVAAYEKSGDMDQGGHALARSFLLALIDADHPDLDYLRAEPAAGDVARQAKARLSEIVARNGGPDNAA